MKLKSLLAIGLIFLVLFTNVGASATQTEIKKFWKIFKTAVIKGDKEAVAKLSRLPVSMPFGVKSVKTKAAFLRRFNEIFDGDSDAARCFKTAKIEKRDKYYEVACGFKSEPANSENKPFVYTFELTKNGWKFVSFDNINE